MLLISGGVQLTTAPSYSAVPSTQAPGQGQSQGHAEKYEGEPPAYSSEPSTPTGQQSTGQPTFGKQ